MDMASMCDIRVAAESARFGESYGRMAWCRRRRLLAPAPAWWAVPQALATLFTADFVEAKEALEIGLQPSIPTTS
jgi:2-(1,2-epoxy-1,2-dihydrophenyl)acetyl-CoA isomerase